MDLFLQHLFADFTERLGAKLVAARTERPFAGGKNFHEVEGFEWRHIISSLGEACSRLAGTGSLHVIIVKIGRVVCEDHIGAGFQHGGLDELHQIQMGNGIELDVRKVAENGFTQAENLLRTMHIAVQLLELRALPASGRLAREYARPHREATRCQKSRGGATTQHLVIRVGDNNQYTHGNSCEVGKM
jgi:hypothetical protein